MPYKMRFQVSGHAECFNCPARGRDQDAGFFTEEIVAEHDDAAKDVFMKTRRLCKRCRPKEEANLQFSRDKLSVVELGYWK